jgi:biotin operon repressor
MSEQDHATRLLQALADPTRLRLVAALLEQPACVEELAERLGLSAPTISHHLGKLDQAGLLNRRREQYYTVCEARPGPLERTLRDLVAMASGQPAAETLRLEQYRQRTLDTFFANGRLRQLPAQRKKRQVVLAAIAADFAPGREYAEDEVNAIIGARYDDYCTVRRELVDDGILQRDKATGPALRYRRVGAEGIAPLPAPGTCAGATIVKPGRTTRMDSSSRADTPVTPKTDRQRRKEWIELYKQARRTAGVYAIRNTTNGRVLLGSSVNLHGPFNRHRTELRLGSHRCPELQADWNRLGEDAFAFEILETVPDALTGLERDTSLGQLEKKWIAAYQPLADRCYNTSEKIRVRQF